MPRKYFDGTNVVPNGTTPTQYIMNRNNRRFLDKIFTVPTNTDTSYNIGPFPILNNIPLVTAYKHEHEQ